MVSDRIVGTKGDRVAVWREPDGIHIGMERSQQNATLKDEQADKLIAALQQLRGEAQHEGQDRKSKPKARRTAGAGRTKKRKDPR